MFKIKYLKKKFSQTAAKLIFEYNKKNCKVILNNPKVLNSIDGEMIDLFKKEIKNWESSKNYPEILMITSKNPKAFSAGGDIKDMYYKKSEYTNQKKNSKTEKSLKVLEKENQKNLESFFKKEYELNYLLNNLKKKKVITISLWNGLVIGGGVGISINSSYKICSQKTLLTMPESRIGLFVDVGVMKYMAGFLNNGFGRGLGNSMVLAGHRLKGKEVVMSGIGSHFVPEEFFGELENRIFEMLGIEDFLERNFRVLELLSRFEGRIERGERKRFLDFCLDLNDFFDFDSVEEIFEKCCKSEIKEIGVLYRNMVVNSPLSMKVNFFYLNFARNLDIKYVYQTDFRLIQNFMDQDEFFIGVKNLLIDRSRERPNWTYDRLEDVPDDFIVDMFLKDKEGHDLRLDSEIFD